MNDDGGYILWLQQSLWIVLAPFLLEKRLLHWRRGAPKIERENADSFRIHFLAQAVGNCPQRMFRSRILSDFRPLYCKPDTRVDKYDLPVRSRQKGQQALTQQVWCANISGILEIEILDAATFHQVLMNNSGAVNQNVELATFFFQVIEKILKVFLYSNVHWKDGRRCKLLSCRNRLH